MSPYRTSAVDCKGSTETQIPKAGTMETGVSETAARYAAPRALPLITALFIVCIVAVLVPDSAFAATHAEEDAAGVMNSAGKAASADSPDASGGVSSDSSGATGGATPLPTMRLFAKAASATTSTSASPTSGITLSSSHTHRSSDLKGTMLRNVVDLSEFNTVSSFKKLKAAGIDAIILRCGYQGYGSGGLYSDSTFLKKYVAAKRAGLKVGVYFYTEAIKTSEASKQASFVKERIAEAAKKAAADSTFKSMMAKNASLTVYPDYYVAFDYEANPEGRLAAANISQTAGAKIATTFLSAIKSAGYEPILYTGADFSARHVNAAKVKSAGYDIWFAHYSTNPLSYQASGWYTGKISLWQCDDAAKVSSISGLVDFDYAYEPTTVSLSTANDKRTIGIGKELEVSATSIMKHFGKANEKYKWVSSDTGIATVNGSGTVSTLKEGTVKITATGKTSGSSKSITLTVKASLIKATLPSKPKLSGKAEGKYAKLTWKAVKNAEWYTVVDSKQRVVKKTTGTSATVNIGYGATASYSVIPYRTSDDGNIHGSASNKVTVKTKPTAVTGFKVRKTTKSYVKLSWKKSAGAKTYRIYRSANGGKSYKKMFDTKRLTYKNTKVTRGKTYRYKIRAIAANGQRSSVSPALKVKMPR